MLKCFILVRTALIKRKEVSYMNNIKESKITPEVTDIITDIEIEKKFISSLTLDEATVQSVLKEKIDEENSIVLKNTTNENIKFEKELFSNINHINGAINVVSLFSGAGGLDLGVELANLVVEYGEKKAYQIFKDKRKFEKSLLKQNTRLNVIYTNDIFVEANQSYRANFMNTVVSDNRDIRKVANFPKSNLMLGGFPCPGFSAAGPRLLDDPRNFLYIHYIRALMQSNPAFFVAENVKGLMTMANGQVLNQIEQDFSAAGYKVSTQLVNARDYGVPQSRERVFIVGVRKDIVDTYNFEYACPSATHGTSEKPWVNLYDAIGDLPYETDDYYRGDYSSMYMSRNRKKTWNDQSFTIQASGRQAPQHPAGEPMEHVGKDLWEFRGSQNRRLSVREVARIQTFPDWYNFSDGNNGNATQNHRLNQQYKQIGNAVPVYLGEKMVRPIIEFFHNHPELL
ncbi:modification methylase BspRI [Enterococcus casseliflavus 14-MB-W-14]|nr:modification methylase BspRI [Enterococcus casseliflavus 14-MB-W-14]